MVSNWVPIVDFPGYSINSYGEVLNDRTNKFLRWNMHREHPFVSLMQEGRQVARPVAKLMLLSWAGPHRNRRFTTPTHLDGNKMDCSVDNLTWRPRWFALAYHKECVEDPFRRWSRAFILIETDEVFYHIRDCAQKYGLLQRDIHMALVNQDHVFPGNVSFRWERS